MEENANSDISKVGLFFQRIIFYWPGTHYEGCKCNFRRVNNFGYSKLLFIIRLVDYDVSNILFIKA